uniref:Uncharacterized protein n=1 Tax=Phaseolus vulgaris TaxID=3885 RepID=V7C6E6_PHAVU|nr:hypothetical protein PHAVU_004G167300g [Phaseolus vulgaris]ESW24865.1 hypothetical protein PHAVU_004G167300g [Phaseolus vulgaris]
MGNSIRTVGLLNAPGVRHGVPFHHQLGRDGFIHLSERELKITRGESWSEKWTMSYTLGPSTSILSFTRSGKGKGATGLFIKLLSVIPEQNGKFSRYGYELDVETVPNSDALEPHAVTLAHYFAYSGCIDHISRNRREVGLSVIVKIGATNGNLDITVEGPDEHSSAGLRFMFKTVMRVKIWKPNLCLHCAVINNDKTCDEFPFSGNAFFSHHIVMTPKQLQSQINIRNQLQSMGDELPQSIAINWRLIPAINCNQ